MTVPGSTNPLLAYKSSAAAYTVSRSLRFNSADASFLSRTFGTPTAQGTFTFSAWVKRSRLGLGQRLFGASTNHFLQFDANDALNLTFAGVSRLTTTAFFRDAAAWYHVVWTQSGTSHTIYVNGTSVGTATATSSVFNTAVAHQIGAANTANYFNGYLTEIHFIDGQALDPSSFAETNATTGQWVPRQFSGTYGTNGFKLTFSDNSNTTAATLGADTSGNGNNWTPNNFSVTAGVGNDSLRDTPTSSGTDTGVGGEVSGNYCTLNPLQNSTLHVLSDGNLRITGNTGGYGATAGTIGMSSGKWYWEQTLTAVVAQDINLGIGNRDTVLDNSYIGQTARSYGFSSNSRKWNGGVDSVYTTAWTNGNIIGLAFDADAGTLTLYKNGVSLGVAFSGIPSGDTYFPMAAAYGTTSISNLNFGQRAFAYTAPSGFSPLVDTLLPTPTIAKPNTVMDALLWTGNGSARSITGLGFNPDLVWIKGRSNATDHALYDAVRGTEKRLESNTADAEVTSDGGVTAFNSDGFSLGTLAQVNTNSATYVGWAWDAGSSNATNTSGSTQSTVRASISAGFSVVTYAPSSSAVGTVGHGLGVALEFYVVKKRSLGTDWAVYHKSIGATKYLRLNGTLAATTDTMWNNTEPTSSVFSYGKSESGASSGDTYVAYCWTPVAGYSAFGSYTGNGSATDGPFVYTGFRPKFIIFKRTDTTGDWLMYDAVRNTYNVTDLVLYPNLSNAETQASTTIVDLLSNGFKWRGSGALGNASGGTYIYACFAESPLAYARAR